MKEISIKFYYILFTCFLFTSCGNNDNTNKSSTSNSSLEKSSSSKTTLSIDNELLKKYKDALKTDTIARNKIFIKQLLGIIHKFNGRALDTTMLLTGNIEGEGNQDSIQSRVHLLADTVYVDSWWIQNKDTLWHYRLKNPYSSYDNSLFEYDTRSPWVVFAIGILQSAPEFYKISKFESGSDVPRQMILDMGISDLKEKGINISSSEYDIYLKNYKGDLLLFEEPEVREGLFIWYKPSKCFISYYHP